MVDFTYTHAKYLLYTQQLNLITSNIKMMLVDTDYTPNPENVYIDDGTLLCPAAHELSGTGYSAGFGGSGRKLLTNKSFFEDSDAHKLRFTFDNISWLGINAGTAGGAIVVLESGISDMTGLLIWFRNSGGLPKITNGDDLIVTIDPLLGFFAN